MSASPSHDPLTPPYRLSERFVLGRLSPADVRLLAAVYSIESTLLNTLVLTAQQYAVAPVSGFSVGAVALGRSGAAYLGANREFHGLPLTASVHAEQAAIACALAHGETALDAIAISAAPCGLCRQFMMELDEALKLRILVGEAETTLARLLPNAFGPLDLGVSGRLLSHPPYGLELARNDDELASAAMRAAQRCYAPYTQCPSGVALLLEDGAIVASSYIESAAHNPSLSPMAAALSNARFAGSNNAIVRAVLVELEKAPVQQVATAVSLLAAVSSVRLEMAVVELTSQGALRA